jgi:6-phosphogluconolactonase
MSSLHVLPDESRLAESAADQIAQILTDALHQRERATFVLTGGDTPAKTYQSLAERHGQSLDWSRIDIFWGDDRFVPHDSDESNFRMAKENLLEKLPTSECNVFPFPTHLDDADQAARAYEETLRAYFADAEPAFDLVLFGLGPDGHVASLFPGADSLDEQERWVLHTMAPEDQPPRERVTMTFPLLNASRASLFLVAGEKKREAVTGTLDETADVPARQVAPAGELLWYLDEAAAAGVRR